MFHRILVGVDDSTAARIALERAIDLVEAGHGRIGLLSSAPQPPPLPAMGTMMPPISRQQLDDDLVTWAERNLEEAARAVPEDVPITKIVARGKPSRALLREARSGNWDLLVVGQAHRRHLWPFLAAGERLNRRSPTPVLVVHEEPAAAPRGRRSAELEHLRPRQA
jgi:nucleotide-binding universal stress UspA family protein